MRRCPGSHVAQLAGFGLGLLASFWSAEALSLEAVRPDEKSKATDTKIIPLPVYATLPNEGNTFGFMPVFLVVESESQRTDSIYAPSVSWNDVVGATGTMRWYHYPDRQRALTLRASVSQRVNWSTLLIWADRPLMPGQWTDDVVVRVERSIFYRFFGIGPETSAASETSHTRMRGQLELRRGLNLGSNFNLGARVLLAGDLPIRRAVPGLPSSQDVFPAVPGMEGAATVGGALDIRYDSRPQYDYSENGFYSSFVVRWLHGVANSPSFARFEFETKGLVQELGWLQLGARLYASYVSSRDAPFFYQSSLGGSFLMRGFTEDRFIDRGAWSVELEQRIRLFETHIYGVTAKWRIDPFIAVGQVFPDREHLFSHVRFAQGVGFRAFVQPNVLGRVDVATAGEGLKVYVELGYPF